MNGFKNCYKMSHFVTTLDLGHMNVNIRFSGFDDYSSDGFFMLAFQHQKTG